MGVIVELRQHRVYRENGCDHGIAFDRAAACSLSASEVRRRWPRLDGPCPKRCGFSGIGYASMSHFHRGGW